MRITAKGQVTIPRSIRESVGLTPGAEVDVKIENGAVLIVRAERPPSGTSRGQQIVESMRGQGDFKMTADEVIALMRGPRAEEL